MRAFTLATLFLVIGHAEAGVKPKGGGTGGRRLAENEAGRRLAEIHHLIGADQSERNLDECGADTDCCDDSDQRFYCWQRHQNPTTYLGYGSCEAGSPSDCTGGSGSPMCFPVGEGDGKCGLFGDFCSNGSCKKCDCAYVSDLVTEPGGFLPTNWFDVGSPEYPSYLSCMCNECDDGYCTNLIVGDPHIKSWQGDWFDYMGQCDLKLLQSKTKDLEIDVRTTIRYDYSFVEAAAIKIGGEVLEVGGFGDYALNGVDGALGPNGHSVPTLGGYPIYYRQVDDKKHLFDIVFGADKNITITTFKDWVGVSIYDPDREVVGDVAGLMGTINGGENAGLLSPEGVDLSADIDAYGQSWQIQEGAKSLFRTVRAPQAPQKCVLPDPTAAKVARRLGETLSRELAEKACAGQHDGQTFKFCVHDVMASGDLSMANGAF